MISLLHEEVCQLLVKTRQSSKTGYNSTKQGRRKQYESAGYKLMASTEERAYNGDPDLGAQPVVMGDKAPPPHCLHDNGTAGPITLISLFLVSHFNSVW